MNVALNEAQLRYKNQIDTYKQDISNLYKQIEAIKQENQSLCSKLSESESLILSAKNQTNEVFAQEKQIQALKKMISILQQSKEQQIQEDTRLTDINQEEDGSRKYHSHSMDQYNVRPRTQVRREQNQNTGQGNQCFTMC